MHIVRLVVLLLSLACSLPLASGPTPQRALTIWLIPSEPNTPTAGIGATEDCETASRPEGALPARIEEEIDRFNASRAQTHVTIINTQEPYKAQLIDWSPEMAVPNLVWVRSQTVTLLSLERFAKQHDLNIRVRFITWDRAFEDLRAAWAGSSSYEPPDVVQIGSTWSGHFQSKSMLLSKPKYEVSGDGWEDVGSTRACVLPYIYDARLIFYWKRLPGESAAAPAFEMHSGSWQAIVESMRVRGGKGPAFAFPIGLTLNLLHDYASLVWAGGGELFPDTLLLGRRLDITTVAATSVPEYLAANSVWLQSGSPRRLIAFPEASHEEASRSFVQGLYRAIIEPANFIARWKRDFACRYERDGTLVSFWNYAGAAVSPTPFKGGSYLAVWARTAFRDAAFELATFLTTDSEYTRMLGISGHLPAHRPGNGVDLLVGSTAGDAPAGATEFARVVQQALDPKVAHTYPPMPDFPVVLESREVLEGLQHVWRRLSERDLAALRASALEVEQSVNRKIYSPARLYSSLVDIAELAAAAIMMFVLVLYLTNRRRIVALEHVAQVRGFSAAGTLLFETIHGVFHNPLEVGSTSRREAIKAAMIVAGLQGWRRGRDESNWSSANLEDVIWRSIILVFDSAICLGVFKEWQQSRTPAPVFLASLGNDPRIRAALGLAFHVSCPERATMPQPFMLEQALVCLLQNAIKTLVNPDFPDNTAKRISVRVDSDELIVSNPGPALRHELCDAINKSQSSEEFEQRINALLADDRSATKPGFGLVEAYCILSQCFGGLRVKYDEPTFIVGLRQPSKAVPSFSLLRRIHTRPRRALAARAVVIQITAPETTSP